MVAQALAHTLADGPIKPQCDLIAQGLVAGKQRGWMLQEDGRFLSDSAAETGISDSDLRALALQPGNSISYTCVPYGNGTRIALDRDEDGIFNQDDDTLMGKARSSASPANPLAPKEVDELTPARKSGFTREANQKLMGDFPSFRRF